MAQWYKFTKDFDYKIQHGVEKAFKAGTTVFLKEEQAVAADAAKVGHRVTKEQGEPAPPVKDRQ